jgi:hypothetical protein
MVCARYEGWRLLNSKSTPDGQLSLTSHVIVGSHGLSLKEKKNNTGEADHTDSYGGRVSRGCRYTREGKEMRSRASKVVSYKLQLSCGKGDSGVQKGPNQNKGNVGTHRVSGGRNGPRYAEVHRLKPSHVTFQSARGPANGELKSKGLKRNSPMLDSNF